MKKLIAILLIMLISCNRRIPNYKVTPNGYKVYKRTKQNESTKDILSNGDTLEVFSNKIGYRIIPHK